MRIKPVKQKNGIACGPTSIFMVVRSFPASENKISLRKIEKESDYKRTQGMDDIGVTNTFNKLGYSAEIVKNCSWEKLLRLNLDQNARVIVSWMKDGYKGHLSVLSKIDNNYIYLADPDIGKIIKIEKIKFMRLWMEYDGHWWPRTNQDINLRTIIKITK